jgi:hypothetical protein
MGVGAAFFMSFQLIGLPDNPRADVYAHLSRRQFKNGSPTTTDEVAYFKFDDVATAQLAIDRKIEHRPVAYPLFAI